MILVTGANGTNGSEILKRLSGKDAAVRATVRIRVIRPNTRYSVWNL